MFTSPQITLQKKKALEKIALNVNSNDPRDQQAKQFANKFTSQKTLIEKMVHEERSNLNNEHRFKMVDFKVQDNRERALSKLKEKIKIISHPNELVEVAKK